MFCVAKVYCCEERGRKILDYQRHEEVSSSFLVHTAITEHPDAHLISPRWITNGHFSDYFTVACKTKRGLTVFLVERGEGVATKPIKTSYSSSAGTAFVTFDNVKVPSENILGKEDAGLIVVLSNFNHERWVICCTSARVQRMIVEECFK